MTDIEYIAANLSREDAYYGTNIHWLDDEKEKR